MGGMLRRRKGAGSEGSFGSDLIRVFHDERGPRDGREREGRDQDSRWRWNNEQFGSMVDQRLISRTPS